MIKAAKRKTLKIIGGSILLVVGIMLVYLNWFKILPGFETRVEQFFSISIAYGILIGPIIAFGGACIVVKAISGKEIGEIFLQKFFPEALIEDDDLEEIESGDVLNLEELLNSEEFEKVRNSEDFCTYFEIVGNKVICKDSSDRARK